MRLHRIDTVVLTVSTVLLLGSGAGAYALVGSATETGGVQDANSRPVDDAAPASLPDVRGGPDPGTGLEPGDDGSTSPALPPDHDRHSGTGSGTDASGTDGGAASDDGTADPGSGRADDRGSHDSSTDDSGSGHGGSSRSGSGADD